MFQSVSVFVVNARRPLTQIIIPILTISDLYFEYDINTDTCNNKHIGLLKCALGYVWQMSSSSRCPPTLTSVTCPCDYINVHIRLITVEPFFCSRNRDFQERWPLFRVKFNTFMLRFTLSSGLSRGVGLL